MTIQHLVRIETHNTTVIELMYVEGEYHIDSRIVASGLGTQHQNFIETTIRIKERNTWT